MQTLLLIGASRGLGAAMAAEFASRGWSVVGTGDYNHDGKTDLTFQNDTTGVIAQWFLNDTAIIGVQVLAAASGWHVI